MSEHVTVTEAARHLADYLNRVVYRGESFVLVRGNKPVAELRPPTAGGFLRDLPAMMDSIPRLSSAEAAEMAETIESARRNLSGVELADPWGS